MEQRTLKRVIIGVFILLSNCSLFDTDKPETPVGQIDVDPFDFKEVLRGTVEQFTFEDYKELFDTTFTYVDPELIQFDKSQLLDRLIDIKDENTNQGILTIQVDWFKTDSTTDKMDKNSEVTLNPRGYSIYLQEDSIPRYSGEATFKVRYIDDVTEWVITYWRDLPTGGADKSYFHPYFP